MRLVELLTVSIGLLFVANFDEASGELFTSTEMIRGIFFAQKAIANELKTYVSREKDRIAKVRGLIDSLERDSTIPESDLLDLMSNPVEIYRAVRHHQRDRLGLDNLLGNVEIFNVTDEKIELLMRMMPSNEDYIGSIDGLLRLQETYALDTKELIEGHVRGGARNGTRLDIDDMFEAGRLAYTAENYDVCLKWMNEALERLPTEGTPKTKVDRPTLLDYLSFANFKVGNIERALAQTLEFLQFEPNHERALANVKHYKHVLGLTRAKGDLGKDAYQSPKDKPLTPKERHQRHAKKVYNALCRGEKIFEVQDEHYLHCDYATNNDPRLLIAPLKRETLHFNPLIMLYHDVISDDEIKFIKKTALPKLRRGMVRNSQTNKPKPADDRITKTAWLFNDTDNYYLPRLNRRASQITQLNMETSEDFQVANYGIGGYYGPHLDHVRANESVTYNNRGNRIATLMFYLSNVRAGGATVFPELGLSVFPEKGAAIVWFNLFRNGDGNNLLIHSACPVLYGNKWVMNKWFHTAGNEFWHPCGTDRDAPFTIDDLEFEPVTHQRCFGRVL